MYRVKILLGVSVVCAATLAITGCSPVSSGGGENELTIMSLGNGDDDLLKALAEEFESANPDVTVTINNIPEDVYVTKFDTAVLAGDSPDLAVVYGKGFVGSFQPLNDTLYADLDLADYNQAVLDGACGLDGDIYCMGGFIGGLVLAYNKEIFTAAGVPFPSVTEPLTMSEYATLAAELQDAGTEWGGDAPTPTYWVDYGVFLDDTGRTAELTDPDYVAAFESLAGMVEDGTAPGPATLDATGSDDAMRDLFLEGKAAMMILDSGSISSGEPLPIDVGFAPTPVPSGGSLWVSSWTNAFGIPVGAKHVEEATEFLALLGTSGQALESDRGHLPLRLADAEAYVAQGEAQAQFSDLVSLAQPTVFTPNLFAWTGIIDDTYYAVLRGDAEAESGLAEAEPKVQQVLDTTWEAFDASMK